MNEAVKCIPNEMGTFMNGVKAEVGRGERHNSKERLRAGVDPH